MSNTESKDEIAVLLVLEEDQLKIRDPAYFAIRIDISGLSDLTIDKFKQKISVNSHICQGYVIFEPASKQLHLKINKGTTFRDLSRILPERVKFEFSNKNIEKAINLFHSYPILPIINYFNDKNNKTNDDFKRMRAIL